MTKDADATSWEQRSAAAAGSPVGPKESRSDSARPEQTLLDHSGQSPPEDSALPSAKPATPGKIFGEYELLDEIARGGMGVVYRARQTKLNRVVALKMILAGELASASDVQRFYNEAEAAASLHHPCIVPIFDIGEFAGQHYFSMGYIEGTNLATVVRDGPLPARDAARFCEQIADAIAYAHQQGIIHRDLKPGNVLLDSSSQPHVTDFGLAKIIQGDSDLTGTGQVMGTPSYMPPEQASGKIHDVGPTSDVYSLGAILYFLLTARPPFQASSLMETLKQVMEQEPVSPRQLNPGVPPDLETICLKCLEKPQNRRYASARELASELGRFLKDEPILARPVTGPARAWRWCRRNPGIAGLLLAIALSLLFGIGFSTYFAILADVQLREAQKNERAATQAQARAQAEAEKAAASAAQAERERNSAEESKKRAEGLREFARRQLEAAAPRTYLGDIRRAQLEWPKLHTVQRLAILQAHDPRHAVSPTQTDPRGWEWYYLRGLSEPNEHVLSGQTSFVDVIEWSRDGKWLASASSDNQQKEATIRIWNASTGKIYRPLRGHKAPATAIAWHPAGNRLATGHENGDVIVWDITSGTALKTLNRGKAPIPALCYSPAGDTLAAAVGDAVCLWDPATGEVRKSLTGHARAVRRIKWNASGKLLATSALFDSVRIWDMASTAPVKVIEHTASWALGTWSPAIAWHADGKTFAWESSRTRVSVVDLEDPAKRPEVCADHTPGANDLEFSPDGLYLAAFGPEKVSVWNWRAGGKPVAAPSGTIGGWLADSSRLLLAQPESPGRIEVFDVSEKRPAGVFDGHLAEIYALRPSPLGRQFASAGADRTVRLWTLDDAPEQVRRLETPRGPKLTLAELSPDCRALAAYSRDREQILVFDVQSGKRLRILPLAGGDGPVLSLAWGPDGALLASSSLLPGDQGTGRLILWDVTSGTQIRSIGGGAQLTNISLSPDGSKLAARNQKPDSNDDRAPDPSADNASLPWIKRSVAKCPPSQDFSKQSVVHFKNYSSVVVQLIWLDFSGNRQPNYGSLQPGEDRKQSTGAGHAWLIADAAGNELGHFVAAKHDAQANITGDSAIDVFSARTGERLSRLISDARDWAWSPDGTQIVTADHRVWETATGKQVGSVGSRFEPPLAWSPDGKRLAAARFDQNLEISRLCVWNFETKSLAVSVPFRSRIGKVRWTPDSSRVLTVTSDEVSVWDPSTPEMPALTFPEADAALKRPPSDPIIDARWSLDGKTLCWATSTAVQSRVALVGYRQHDPSTAANGSLYGRTSAVAEISIRPAQPATLVFRLDSFVRQWHFSPRSKPWPDRDHFVIFESGEFDRLQAAALAAPAVVSQTPYINFLPQLTQKRQNVAAYALSRITSEAAQTLRLYVGSDAAARIWLNGDLVVEAVALRSAQLDQETTDVRLNAGLNTLVVEITNGSGDCGFYLRLEHEDGTPAVINGEGRISTHRGASLKD